MDETKVSNLCILKGSMVSVPRFSHTARGEDFYTFPLAISRLSGTEDIINISARSALLDELDIAEGKLCISGEVRSFNNKSGEGARLVISVFARELWFESAPDENSIELRGSLCKPPKLRRTPMGREICDLMVAVNRRYGRSDYLPCIAWGSRAREAADWQVGDSIALTGRIQSRKYTKLTEKGAEEKTAYEISAAEIFREDF